jgi:hypothetical protein
MEEELKELLDKIECYNPDEIEENDWNKLIFTYWDKILSNRYKAKGRVKGWIKKLPRECLPKYFTHDDEDIRKMASERCDQLTQGDEL